MTFCLQGVSFSFLFILAVDDHIDLRGTLMPCGFTGVELTADPLIADGVARG